MQQIKARRANCRAVWGFVCLKGSIHLSARVSIIRQKTAALKKVRRSFVIYLTFHFIVPISRLTGFFINLQHAF
jgi:hypothetical protein